MIIGALDNLDTKALFAVIATSAAKLVVGYPVAVIEKQRPFLFPFLTHAWQSHTSIRKNIPVVRIATTGMYNCIFLGRFRRISCAENRFIGAVCKTTLNAI
jgi:hypothetical protein